MKGIAISSLMSKFSKLLLLCHGKAYLHNIEVYAYLVLVHKDK